MKSASNHTIFFDFDNTITNTDVLDRLLERFAEGDDWVHLERQWQDGEIGSRDCLLGQMNCVRADNQQILDFLQTIKLDPHFKELLEFIQARKYPAFIISDSFDFLIDYILKHNKITSPPIYANHLRVEKDAMKVDFLNGSAECHKCANCKKEKVKKHSAGKCSVYIGDGLSDICAAESADIVFAKDKLLEHGRRKGHKWIAFETLKDVKEHLEKNEK